MAERKQMRRARRFALRALIPTQLSLGLLWFFLWGEWSWSSVLMGLVIATIIPMVFYLPPVGAGERIHVGWVLWYVLRLFIDIVKASFIVAGQAFGIGYSRDNAVIGVRLRTTSDIILTVVAESSTLVPGTLVIDVDRESRDLYLHVFSVRSPEQLEKARKDVLHTEELAILAIGSPEEVRMVREARAARTVAAASDADAAGPDGAAGADASAKGKGRR